MDFIEEDWLFENRELVNRMLDESFAEAERGEGYSPEEVKAHLDEHRAIRLGVRIERRKPWHERIR